jgi:hypothetical protein
MNEDVQKQFVGWLAQKLQAKDEQDLKSKMQQMGSQGIKQAYQAFMQEQQSASQGNSSQGDSASVPARRLGGKLDYIKCLQAFKKGGKMEMDKCGCGAKMQDGGSIPAPARTDYIAKHQSGGNIYQHANSIPAVKANGSIGNFANGIAQGTVMLHPTQLGGAQQLSPEQIAHLRTSVPNFDRVVGQPIAAAPGQVQRYGPDQSDILRKMVTAYPMPTANPLPQGMAVATQARGGKIVTGVADHTMGKRKDTNTMTHKKASMTDTKLSEHSQGDRMDSGFKNHTQGTRKDINKMAHKKGSRKDQSTMTHQHGTRSEGNTKKKDYVGFAKKGMSMQKCQDGGDMDSQKKGGSITAAQKKDIALKRMDMKKQMGGTMGVASTPANASKRMAGVAQKKKGMQAASMNKLGGLLGK